MHWHYSIYHNKPSEYLIEEMVSLYPDERLQSSGLSWKSPPQISSLPATTQAVTCHLGKHLKKKCAMIHVNEHCNLQNCLPDYQLAYDYDYSCKIAIVKASQWPTLGHVKSASYCCHGPRLVGSLWHGWPWDSGKCTQTQFWTRGYSP